MIGVNLLLGYTGLLSLATGCSSSTAGSSAPSGRSTDWGLSPWLGFPVAFVVGMGMGAAARPHLLSPPGLLPHRDDLAFALVASSLALLFPGAFNSFAGRGVTEPLDTEFSFLDPSTPTGRSSGLYLVGRCCWWCACT